MVEAALYTVHVLDPAPAMTQTEHEIEAQDYPTAVFRAHQIWREHRRPLVLRSHGATYWWHRVDASGHWIDRNQNGGVAQDGHVNEWEQVAA